MAWRFEPHTLHECGVKMCTCSRRKDRLSGSKLDCRERNVNDQVEQLGSEIKYLAERKTEACKCRQHGGAAHSELPEGHELFRYDALLHHFVHSWKMVLVPFSSLG